MIRIRYRLLIAAIACCWVPAAWAGGYAVVYLDGVRPFVEALAAFKKAADRTVRAYPWNPQFDASALARQIKRQRPDVLLAMGSSALKIARDHLPDVPRVFAFVLHPGKRRGGETGIRMLPDPEQTLMWLQRFLPQAEIVATVYDPLQSANWAAQARKAARKLGFKWIEYPVGDREAAFRALEGAFQNGDAFWMPPDTTVVHSASFERMLHLSLHFKHPIIGLADKHVRAGALFSLTFDSRELGRQAAMMAYELARGRMAPYLVFPQNPKLAINALTAKRLGVAIPQQALKAGAEIYAKEEADALAP